MRARTLIPIAVTAFAGALGVFAVGGPAGASGSSGATGASGSTGIAISGSGVSGASGVSGLSGASGATGSTGTGGTGTGTGTGGTAEPRRASRAYGKVLFVQNCQTCHAPDAVGSGRAPQLQGVGAATVDLWLSSGWMPLAEPGAQPETKPPRFDREQINSLIEYITSLAPSYGVGIPSVDPNAGDVANGFDLFALNCAGCHTITGAGDELGSGIRAPSLHGVTPVEIAEAIETGPGNMPIFSRNQLSPSEVNDIVAYVVHYIQTPSSPGGLSLGGVGPVAEGFVGLFVGVGACMLLGFWIGDRTEKEEDESGHGDGHGHGTDQGDDGDGEGGGSDEQSGTGPVDG